ncbi:MAG: DUF3563 family protein [Casimicrobiaceae bacterium]
MSNLQNRTPDRAEAYVNRSLIGHISTYLADSIAEVSGTPHATTAPTGSSNTTEAAVEQSKPSAAIRSFPRRPARDLPRQGLLARMEARLWRQEQKRREAWLAESADIFDLERRMRELERGHGPDNC